MNRPDSKTPVALVTASSAGLGAAAARSLALHGYRVVVNYFSSKEKADHLLEELSNQQPIVKTPDQKDGEPSEEEQRFIAIKADISKRPELIRLVDEAVSAMGRLDVVVSNQGWTRIRDFNDLDDNVDEDDWDRCFNMNVKSHVFLMHAAKSHLQATEGSFITTASLAGVTPSGSSLAYSVTKAAQIYLVKALAKIVGPSVRVNSVSPGILLTDWGRQFPQEKLEAAINKSILKRLATVEDVALQIAFLAQSRSTTGTNSVIDAGWSL